MWVLASNNVLVNTNCGISTIKVQKNNDVWAIVAYSQTGQIVLGEYGNEPLADFKLRDLCSAISERKQYFEF